MLLAFFLSRHAKGLALVLGPLALAGCTLDFDRFAPVSGSAQETGPGPDLEAGGVEAGGGEDVATAPPADASGTVDAGSLTDANPGGRGDSTADGAACTEPRSVSFGGHCYFALTSRSNWMAAATTCQATGAHLVTLGSVEEQTAVAALSSNQDRWIGLERSVTSLPVAASYEWITGEPVGYGRWANGEPNFTGECVRMMQGGTWADNPCTTSYFAVCERE